MRYTIFCFGGAWTGILSMFSTPGAVCAAVILFGYGVDEVCAALKGRS